MEDSITKTRSLSHELNPAVLTHSSIVNALKWPARHVDEQFGLKMKLEIHELGQQNEENTKIKSLIFRSTQELLFNLHKHADAKDAQIIFSISDEQFLIKVRDTGKGFNPNTCKTSIEKKWVWFDNFAGAHPCHWWQSGY